MKEILCDPDVAKGFPTRAFKPHGTGGPSQNRRNYLELLEDCLLCGIGQYKPFTMLNLSRLRNVWDAIDEVVWTDVPGDFIETGVWRGGACIFAKACFGEVSRRKVFVADSFAGLPPPDPRYPADAKDLHYLVPELSVSLEEVRENFKLFNLLDDRVVFLRGWFDQSLPLLDADQKFCVIRLDGDMYQSTMDALVNLYDKLSPGGFCIIDDFGAIVACQKAVNQFRHDRGIDAQMYNIDGTGIFWQKERG